MTQIDQDARNQMMNQAAIAAQNVNGTTGAITPWQSTGLYAAQQVGSKSTRTIITIDRVENGIVVTVEGRTYVVASGESLIDTLRVALVSAQLEN